ncbi:universal stress protein [Streptomyces fuscichromogenes]|uniref:universal stress protein n=1 Tax=Streptomyces fuscichromogenes TaxID=1324013 RepID=UPI003823EB23
MAEGAGNSIVVGVDGSQASLAALRWAAAQARSTHLEVVAVHAWERAGAGFAPYAPAPVRPTTAEQRAEAAHVLAGAVRTVFGPDPGGAVRQVVREGPPARVLLEQARGALLLALGHGIGVQRDLPALGAVGRACVRAATVPVVTVPYGPPATLLKAVGMSPGPRRGAA